MITVSNHINNLNTRVNSGSLNSNSLGSDSSYKSYADKNFQAKNSSKQIKDNRKYKEDTLLENTWKNRVKFNIEKTFDIPLMHFPRGLGGAPDYTFFEYLQTAKLPYYVGGPILAALFYAGVKKDNFKSAQAANGVAKRMALGVGLYYLGAALAKSVINRTVKMTRGIDLKHPYAKAISTSTKKSGVFKKDVEYHSAFESTEFTRTDLLYNKKGATPDEINERYIKLGKKFGVKTDTNDVDQTVKPLIKKTIIMARAWQYALTAFYVTLGIGMANQPAWMKTSAEGFKNTIKNGVFGKNVPDAKRLHNAKIALKDYILKPFGNSFKEFWQGHSKVSSIVGKSVILSAAAATLLAISLIVGKTSAKGHSIDSSGSNSYGGESK